MTKKRQTDSAVWEWRESKDVRHQDDLCTSDPQRAGGSQPSAPLATLRWQGCFSQRAIGSAPGGQWTFDRPRLLSRDVEVYDPAGERFAVLQVGWWGDGTLHIADGRIFYWRLQGFLQTHALFFDSTERPVVEFWDSSRWFENRTQVGMPAPSLSERDHTLLILLGRYLMVLKQRDAAVVVATTACVTV
jgi:hypothetical protein